MGYTVHTCTVCGHSYEDCFVQAKGHTYTQELLPATCTEHGFVRETCTTCGHSYISAVTEPLGHTPRAAQRPRGHLHPGGLHRRPDLYPVQPHPWSLEPASR